MSLEPPTDRWLTGRCVLFAGLLLAATMLTALVTLFVQERRHMVSEQLARNELYARVLEDHVSRSIETAAVSLANLASDVAKQGPGDNAMNPSALTQMLAGLPQLRAVAALDLQGRVLASSEPADVGKHIDLKILGPLPAEGLVGLGPNVAGRGLSDAARDSPARAVAPLSVSFMPLLRRVSTPDVNLLLVALVHTEGLANQMRLITSDPASHIMLTGLDGLLYTDTETHTDTTQSHVGQSLRGHPAFLDYLPRTEHASYRGIGVGPGAQIVAFRVSRTQPLVVLVERSLESVLSAQHQVQLWRLSVVSVFVLAIAALSWTAARTLRARERVRQRLDLSQAEVTRRRHELGVIVRSVQELLFRTDADGVLTFVNGYGPTAAGGLSDAAVGSRFEALVKPDERASVRSMFDTQGRSDDVRSATVTFGTAGERARRFDIAAVPLYENGRVIGFAGSAVDITEREEAQARLADQLAFSALLLELSPSPTAMYDSEGRYITVNRAWQEYAGPGNEVMPGDTMGRAMSPEEVRLNAVSDRALLDGGGRLRAETAITHLDGSRRDLLVNKVVVPGQDGQPQGILCTFMDVTELRTAARATQDARAAAEESSRAKSEFIANISHELRTPLQAIIGFSELGTLPGRSPDRLVLMFPDILAAGRRMLALVNDLLDVSKLDSAVGMICLEPIDLRPLLHEVLRELQPLLAARQLTVDTDLPAVPLMALADPVRFAQVIRNVLANAIKFSPIGRAIVLVAQAHGDDNDAQGPGGAHVTVRDHGPGVPPGELEQLFEAFGQSSTTRYGSGGTGLGLAISRKIIAAHGGSIGAETLPDGGSRFHIYLPPSCMAG